MLRQTLIVAGIGLLGLVVGAAVAGRPDDVPDDVVATRLQEVTSTTGVATSAPEVAPAAPSTTASSPPAASSAPATASPSPTTTTTTTTPAPPPTSAPPLRPEGEIRLVVANATDAPGLAARTTAELRELGYVDSVPTDAVASRPDTVIVYADGLSGEALRLAGQLGLDPTRVQPRGSEQLTASDAGGELWLLLGADN